MMHERCHDEHALSLLLPSQRTNSAVSLFRYVMLCYVMLFYSRSIKIGQIIYIYIYIYIYFLNY